MIVSQFHCNCLFIRAWCTNVLSSEFQNNSNNQTVIQGPTTSESNNLLIAKPPSGSVFGKPRDSRSSKHIRFIEQSFLERHDGVTAAGATKADLELLAQNRGNAMRRYKEKKKTRRWVLPLSLFEISLIQLIWFLNFQCNWWIDMRSTFGMNQGRQEPIVGSEWKVDLWRLAKLLMVESCARIEIDAPCLLCCIYFLHSFYDWCIIQQSLFCIIISLCYSCHVWV